MTHEEAQGWVNAFFCLCILYILITRRMNL
jgi:hypothetical protein